LFLLPFYLTLSFKTFFTEEKSLIYFWPKDIIVLILSGLLILTIYISITENSYLINNGPKEVLILKSEFNDKVKGEIKNQSIAARKPYIAYYLNLEFKFLPIFDTIEELEKYLVQNKIDYLYFGPDEAATRPKLKILLNKNTVRYKHLEKIININKPPAAIFKVDKYLN